MIFPLRSVVGGCATAALMLVSTPLSVADDAPRFTRNEVEIDIPAVTLIDQRGDEVDFRELLRSERPLFVDFIFATCTTICPVLSAGFSNIQRKLGDDRDQVHLVSITIDPEHDGPPELASYLERYRAHPGWDFLTGTREDIDRVMKAFDAYVPDKMSHRPLIFIRSPRGGKWVRISGFAGTADLLKERRLAAVAPASEETGP
jgi:protein SCO1/2